VDRDGHGRTVGLDKIDRMPIVDGACADIAVCVQDGNQGHGAANKGFLRERPGLSSEWMLGLRNAKRVSV
jgi:hypothetical protein